MSTIREILVIRIFVVKVVYYNYVIGKIIKENRIAKNYSQQQLGMLLGFSQDTISLWELNKSYPDYETLRKLCVLFDISGDEILLIETDKQRKEIKEKLNK